MDDILVTVVTPMYNSEKFIAHTIESVQRQTHKNFEMLIVDDQSTDNSSKVVREYSKSDSRIHYFCLQKKEGAAGARNLALRKAKGKFIAFLDADDLWDSEKLEKQLKFMIGNNYALSYTNYRLIAEGGEPLNKIRISGSSVNLKRLLYVSSSMGCLTVMYDVDKVGLIQVPLLKKRNDVAMWQNVLKQGFTGYLCNEVLASNRAVRSSLSRSSGKKKLVKHHYYLYRINMDFGIIKSIWYTIFNVFSFAYIKMFNIKKVSE